MAEVAPFPTPLYHGECNAALNLSGDVMPLESAIASPTDGPCCPPSPDAVAGSHAHPRLFKLTSLIAVLRSSLHVREFCSKPTPSAMSAYWFVDLESGNLMCHFDANNELRLEADDEVLVEARAQTRPAMPDYAVVAVKAAHLFGHGAKIWLRLLEVVGEPFMDDDQSFCAWQAITEDEHSRRPFTKDIGPFESFDEFYSDLRRRLVSFYDLHFEEQCKFVSTILSWQSPTWNPAALASGIELEQELRDRKQGFSLLVGRKSQRVIISAISKPVRRSPPRV